MLLLCFVAGAWADEESSGNQGTADAAIVGTSYSLDGKFIAGKGGRMQGNMPDKGVKLRTNKGAWVFAVNAGYRIDKFEFWGCSNDGNTVDIASATVDGGDNLLASAVTVPAKDGSTSADITLTDITARDNITLDFANGSSQIVGTWKITYTQEQVILQEITDVTLNGASIGETALATLKADKAVTIDGSSLNGIGILDVTLSSGATTVNRAFDGDNVVYTFTTNGGADAYTVTVTGVKKTYAAAQGTVVYYNEDALSNGKKTLTIDGVAFNYPSKQFGYANNTAGVTLGETTYKPIKLSTGEAVSVTFPEGKKVKKIIVYGWSAGGLGTGKLVNFTDGGEKSVDTSNDIFYANDGSGSVYPSVYEYEVDNWEALTFQGNGDQPFVVMDFVYAEEAPVTYAITKAVWPEGAATFTLDKETAAAGETVKITDIQLGAGFTSADFVTFGVQGESGNPVEMTMISDGGYPVSYNEIVAYEFVMPAEPVTVNMTFKEPTGTKATFDFVANKWGYPTVSSSMDREKAPLGTFEKDGAKVVFKRAGGNQGYYYNNGTLVEARMMNKNILKVIAPEGKAITKVVFTTSTQYNLAGDGLTEKTWTGNATRASFTAGGSCYFTQIDVTYDDVNAETADPEEADESIILDFSDPLAHDKRFNVTENEYLTEDIVVTDGPAEQGSRVKTTIKPVEGASTATQSYIRYSATGVTMYVRTGGKIVFEADGDKVIKNIKMTAAAFNATLNGEAVTKDQITGEGWNGNSSMVELVATGGTNITDITFTLGDKPVPVAAKYPIEAVVTPAEALTFDYSPKEAAAGEEVTVALSNLVFGEGYSSTDLLTATTSLKTEGGTDVEYTLDAATLSINFTMPAEKVIASLEFAPKTKDIVYDFAAAAAAGENPGNVNGGSANGAIFYGWENEGKTYSKRQDYKGYAWAEGSVLPEECHVWRRSDRINGNMTAADAEVLGLNCPAQREMAINGLSAGQQVVIEYTGEGEILYATGFDAANPTAEPNTVAVVGDGNKAAISGTTTIASGTPIHIVSTDNGYFVFRVLKNMVIQKITISEESAPIDPASVVKPNIVSVSTEIANGTAKADKVQAFEGDEVTVTATPAEGYELDAITVTGVNTNVAVEVTDGKFTMPADDVTISVTFKEATLTAISGINADASADDNDAPAYNLAGQKVGKNYKGIVIKNGKKVVMK